MLHLQDTQIEEIHAEYANHRAFHHVYADGHESQHDAKSLLVKHGLHLDRLDDLGNGWSKRWSLCRGNGPKQCVHVLLQW